MTPIFDRSDRMAPGDPVVAEFVALDRDIGFRRPPVKHERDNADIARIGECLADIEGERVFSQAFMGDRQMLGADDTGVWSGAFRFEDQNFHRAVFDGHGFFAVHTVLLPVG